MLHVFTGWTNHDEQENTDMLRSIVIIFPATNDLKHVAVKYFLI